MKLQIEAKMYTYIYVKVSGLNLIIRKTFLMCGRAAILSIKLVCLSDYHYGVCKYVIIYIL